MYDEAEKAIHWNDYHNNLNLNLHLPAQHPYFHLIRIQYMKIPKVICII